MAENIKYCLPRDIITSLATITASGTVSSDPNYGLSSLYDGQPAKPCKFLTSGPIRITFDFGSRTRIDAFSMPNHNLDAGMTCIVALNNSDSWASPSVQTNLVIGSQHLDGHRASPWCSFVTASGYTTSGYRYLSLYVPANSAAIKIGEAVIIANLRTFSQWAQFNGQRATEREFLEAIKTEYGAVRVVRRKIKRRVFSYTIKGSETDYSDLQNLGDDAGGYALPFFITADGSIKTDGGLYARLTQDSARRLAAQEEWYGVIPFTISIEEVSRSLPL